MVLKSPRGTKVMYRYKKTSKGRVRLGGYGKKGRFLKVTEVKKKHGR